MGEEAAAANCAVAEPLEELDEDVVLIDERLDWVLDGVLDELGVLEMELALLVTLGGGVEDGAELDDTG